MMNTVKRSTALRIFSFTLLAGICLSQEPSNPWPKSDFLEPASLAQELRSAKAPIVIAVAFPVLYRSRHIVHAIDAGPGSKPEGIELLKKAVAGYSKDADIV